MAEKVMVPTLTLDSNVLLEKSILEAREELPVRFFASRVLKRIRHHRLQEDEKEISDFCFFRHIPHHDLENFRFIGMHLQSRMQRVIRPSLSVSFNRLLLHSVKSIEAEKMIMVARLQCWIRWMFAKASLDVERKKYFLYEKQMKEIAQRLLHKRHLSAVHIQGIWRRTRARFELEVLRHRRNAIIVIQSYFRQCIAFRKKRSKKLLFNKRTQSAKVVQSTYRMHRRKLMFLEASVYAKKRRLKERRKNMAKWKLECHGSAYQIQQAWKKFRREKGTATFADISPMKEVQDVRQARVARHIVKDCNCSNWNFRCKNWVERYVRPIEEENKLKDKLQPDIQKFKRKRCEEETIAVEILQKTWRRYVARKVLFFLVQTSYKKVIESEEKAYWYNSKTRRSFWTKPSYLKGIDVIHEVDRTDKRKVVDVDNCSFCGSADSSDMYYDATEAETVCKYCKLKLYNSASTKNKRAHNVLCKIEKCAHCDIQLATRECVCGSYCDICFYNLHRKGFLIEHAKDCIQLVKSCEVCHMYAGKFSLHSNGNAYAQVCGTCLDEKPVDPSIEITETTLLPTRIQNVINDLDKDKRLKNYEKIKEEKARLRAKRIMAAIVIENFYRMRIKVRNARSDEVTSRGKRGLLANLIRNLSGNVIQTNMIKFKNLLRQATIRISRK